MAKETKTRKTWVSQIKINSPTTFKKPPGIRTNTIKPFKVLKKSAMNHPSPPSESSISPLLPVPRRNEKCKSLWTAFLKLSQLRKKFNSKSTSLRKIQNMNALILRKTLENWSARSEGKFPEEMLMRTLKSFLLNRKS